MMDKGPARPNSGPAAPGHPTGVESRSPATKRSAREIQQWFVTYLARLLQTTPETIDVRVPFESFALDSVTALGMTGDLEEWLGRTVDPTVVYDYPTIEALSAYLARPDA